MNIMTITVPKIVLNAFDVIGNEKLEREFDCQEDAANSVWKDIFNNVASEKHQIAYWDELNDKSSHNSFLRYALHRSPKKDSFLQLSVMVIHDEEVIPLSDSQHDNFDDFHRRVIGFDGILVTLK